jgi:dienelactone hydrolase
MRFAVFRILPALLIAFFNSPAQVYPDHILRSCRAVIALIDNVRGDPHIQEDRIYYIGHSYGATLGGLILAAEPRIKAALFMAGLPSISAAMEEDSPGRWKGVKENMRGVYDTALARLKIMEPEDFVQRSKAPVLYQAANKDQFVQRSYTERYIHAPGNRVLVRWYDNDHLFVNPQALADRLAWTQDHHKRKSP